jgi:thioredoxin reductase (NADPH)
VALVGGGNSAGQAAVYLSGFAERVNLLIRGPDLNRNMSRYLVERIAATPNIALHTETELVEVGGDPERHLESVAWLCRRTGKRGAGAIRNLFLFIGAEPETGWTTSCGLALDRSGFVLTGEAVPGGAARHPLESSLGGVFAIGDVRAGSVKRVGGAIGEGAAVVAAIHAALALTLAAA